jgi:SHS2 domain-containing protein
MKKQKYSFLEHTADIKFQAFGKNLEEVFKNSAIALNKTITENLKIKTKNKRKIEFSEKNLEELLYSFLEEFLFLLDAEDFLFSKIETIKIDEKNLKLVAMVLGDNASNYKFNNNVKAITYNEFYIKFDKKTKQWISQIVIDV